MIVVKMGTMKLKAGSHKLAVKPQSKKGAAVMDIRTIVIRPVAD